MPAIPMADSGADGGRDQCDEQRHQYDHGDGATGIGHVAWNRGRGETRK
jgi:hypothetical protein